jgi:hypothetical protein
MRRSLIFSVGLLCAAACSERVAIVEAPSTSAAVWVAPDMAFALPLPEGWAITSSDRIIKQPMYRAEIEAIASEHSTSESPSCRLGVVDFRLFDQFLLMETPELPSEEVDDLARIMTEAVEESVWPKNAYRQMASEGPYDCDCDGNNLVGRFEAFSAEYISDNEARASWQVRFESPDNQVGYSFFASQRSLNENMFTQINCSYPSYSERSRRSAGDLAALRAAMEHLNSARPKPELAAFR